MGNGICGDFIKAWYGRCDDYWRYWRTHLYGDRVRVLKLPYEPQRMRINKAGIDLIKSFEGCRLQAYQDGGGVWTIGWGSTGGVKSGDTLTQAEADALFDTEIRLYEDGVDRLVQVPINENEFAALVSFAYNVGLDEDLDDVAEGLGDSTLLKKLNRGDYIGAADQFLLWVKDNGKVVSGLVRRRQAERKLFLQGI